MAEFDIEITERSVSVKAKPEQLNRRVLRGLAPFGIVIFGSLLAATKFDSESSTFLALLVVFFTPIIFVGVRAMFPTGQSLVCDTDNLTIGRIPDYVLTGRWTYQTFPTREIRELRFAVVRVGKYGGTTGLSFTVNGKNKKSLFGLEAPEASQVLQALSKLGVDTVQDPAMPMVVEMALERRQRKFGLF